VFVKWLTTVYLNCLQTIFTMALPTTLSVAFMFKMSEKVRKEMKIVQQYYTIKMVDKIIDIGRKETRKDDNGAKLNENQDDVFISNI